MKEQENKYRVLVADPPWSYSDHNTGGSFKSGSSQHYTTMKPSTVAKMRVKEVAHDNSVLFLWATTPLLPEIFPVMETWGYSYKTSIFWYKVDNQTRKGRLGLGHYFRGMVEVCLVGIRGDIKPFACQSENVIIEKPREHSRKPEAFWDLIHHALDKTLVPRIELFCRGEPRVYRGMFDWQPVAEWDGWGNQCEGKRKVELDLF